MKVAILGGGFAGVAAAWNLLQLGVKNIELFDLKGIGGGASGMATALLHPFVGPHAKLNTMGLEGFSATIELLEIAASYIGRPVAEKRAILRPALSSQKKEKYLLASKENPNFIRFLEAEELSNIAPGILYAPGIIIPGAMVVYAKEYLEGLWLACESKGAILHKKNIESLDELEKDCFCIVAAGRASQSIKGVPPLSLSFIKGQQIEMEWPKSLPPLEVTINSQVFCTMSKDKTSCFVGATFERDFKTFGEDLEKAKGELLPKLGELYPALLESKILNCRAEVRVSAPKRMPCTKKINKNTWMFTGLASKGLLYHALYGKQVAQEILRSV